MNRADVSLDLLRHPPLQPLSPCQTIPLLSHTLNCVTVSLSLSFSLCISLSLSHTLTHSLSFSLSLSLFLSLFLYLSPSLAHSLTLSLSTVLPCGRATIRLVSRERQPLIFEWYVWTSLHSMVREVSQTNLWWRVVGFSVNFSFPHSFSLSLPTPLHSTLSLFLDPPPPPPSPFRAVVLFVVDQTELNMYGQLAVEFDLWKRYFSNTRISPSQYSLR